MGRVSGLRVRLLLLVFLAALPAVGLLLYTAAEQRWVSASEVQQNALRYARLAAGAEEQLIQSTRQLLVAMAHLPELQGDDAVACSALLGGFLKQYPMYTNLGVAEPDGRVFATALARPETHYGDRAWFRQVLETQDFAVSGYLQGRNTGKAVLGMGYPIQDAGGQVRRVAFTALDLGAIGLVAATADLPEGGTIVVTDGAGTILARYPDSEQWVGRSSPAWAMQRLASTGQDEGVSEGPGVDGVRRLYGYTRLKAADIRVNVGIPLEAVYAPVNRMLTRNLLLFVGATVLMCALAWGLGQALLVGPVGRLRETARRLAAGDLTARAGPTNDRSELGELALSLDRMAGSLQEQQAALRDSESRFRMYMDNSPIYAFMNGAEGRILYNNRPTERFYGIAAGDWRGKTLLDYHPGEAGAQMLADDRRVLEGGETLEATERVQAADGSWHDWRTYKFPLRDATGCTYVGGVAVDVTEQRRAEAALQQHAERLRTLHQIDQAILAAESPEQIAHAALERISLLVPCHRASVVTFDCVAQTAELMVVVADGETRARTGARLRLSDYDELKQLEAGRTVRYDDFEALLNPSPVVETLRREGLRSYLMIPLRAGGDLLGYLGVGARDPQAFGPRDEEVAGEVADQLAVAYRQARLHEQVERHAAELEARVAKRTAALEEVNQELKSFAYSVSHDLHAPLRAMQGFAQALMEDYGGVLDETGQEYARRIVLASERLDRLINDLLAYSRLSRADLPLQPVELVTTVHAVLAQLDADLQSSGARVTIEEPLSQVVGHPATLVQVVSNLVDNALKFVAPDVTPEVRLRTEERGERLRLWVEDNGIGIAPEHQERVFRIFERLHGAEAYPGTGIGLALVRRAVERMGGRVGVESSTGQGSRFWLELPGVGRTT